jgi:TolB-like protein
MGGVESKFGVAVPRSLDRSDRRAQITVGPFTVDLSSMELRKSGRKVYVQEKPVQLLAVLLERPGQLFSRAELRRRLWPANTFVDFEHSINTAVRKLRGALGDDAVHPQFIETVSHHGYRLIAPVLAAATATERPRLLVLPLEILNNVDRRFSKALTEAMITHLGKICTMLDVIAPFPMLRDDRATEQQLAADYLLSGSVLRCGEQVRITVRLVRKQDLCCLWCDSYTRIHPEKFMVQDEISASIAQGVLGRFAPRNSRRLAG